MVYIVLTVATGAARRAARAAGSPIGSIETPGWIDLIPPNRTWPRRAIFFSNQRAFAVQHAFFALTLLGFACKIK